MNRKLPIFILSLFFASHLMAATIYVNHAATGSNNGTSWANAFTSLQSALDAAVSGDEIWMAAGVYKPTKDRFGNANPTDPREKTFAMKNNVILYGGFAGTETNITERNWTTNVTVLSGDLAGNDTTNANGVVLDWSKVVGPENCFNVVTEWIVTCTLDGLTITAGLGDKNALIGLPDKIGNGMMCAWGNTTLTNMVFSGNHGNLLPGGAIYFWEGSGTLDNVSFIGNDGCQGGAAYSRSSNTTYANILFQDNEARDPLGISGTASVSGGGLYVYGTGTTLTNCQFINNWAKISGGGMETYHSITVSNSTFQGNSAGTGGGMFDQGGSALNNISFISNTAHNGGGGGLYCNQLSASGVYNKLTFQNNNASQIGGGFYGVLVDGNFTNCIFTGNHANESGGALYFSYSTPKLTNIIINNNSATNGSVITSIHGQATLTGVTIHGNSGGSLLYFYYGTDTLKIRNSILWGNSGNIYVGDVPTKTRYSDIQGGLPAGWNGVHVLNTDPLFINASSGNYILQNTSPVIDAGDNTVSNPSLPLFDIAGNPRRTDSPGVPDTGLGTAPITDLGAYEWTNCFNPTNGGTIVGVETICQNETPQPLTNTLLPSGGNGTIEYKWQYSITSSSTGFIDISNSNNSGYAPGALTQTTWFKRLARTNCMINWIGAAESNVVQVMVDPIPPTPTINLVGNVLHSSAPAGNQWFDLNGIISGATSQDYTITASGSYYVVVTMLGCSSEHSDTITVIIPGIKNTAWLQTIQIYPNPVLNELNIEFEGNNKKINFEILNAFGQTVFKGNIIDKTIVQVSNFAPGVYIIKFEKGNTFEFKKIIKE